MILAAALRCTAPSIHIEALCGAFSPIPSPAFSNSRGTRDAAGQEQGGCGRWRIGGFHPSRWSARMYRSSGVMRLVRPLCGRIMHDGHTIEIG